MKTRWIKVSVGVIAVVGFAGAAAAQAMAEQKSQSTPKGWNWEMKDGKRVPKGNEVRNADGSWRKETPAGRCITVEEKSADGVYRKFSECPKDD